MVGIIKTTDLCDRCKIDDIEYDLSGVELLIVYPKQKDNSKKLEQFQLIKNGWDKDGCLNKFDFEEIVKGKIQENKISN